MLGRPVDVTRAGFWSGPLALSRVDVRVCVPCSIPRISWVAAVIWKMQNGDEMRLSRE